MATKLEDALSEIGRGQPAAAYLVVGEEFLARKAADELVQRLVPDAAMGLNLVVQDGASPREVASELATLPLFPGAKVVLVRDPEFVAPKKGRGDGLAKAKDAWRSGRRKEGARRLLALAARAGWGAAQLDPSAPGAPSAEEWKQELNVDLAEADLEFLREVAAFCVEERISAPEGDVSALVELLQKGVPRGHALVMVTSEVDAKNPLVRWAGEHGRVVERKVAAKLKDVDVAGLAAEVLAPYRKQLSSGAEAVLRERVGGNMRLLESELEKLAQYAQAATIQRDDVELLVAHAREEEYFELMDALKKRDLRAALRYVHDALAQDVYPLVLLGSIASAVRKLLEARERLDALGGAVPKSSREFEARIYPQIVEEAKAAKVRVPHPYAAFQDLQAAGRYGREHLMRALVSCAEADLHLKGGGASGKLVLERLVWGLCGA